MAFKASKGLNRKKALHNRTKASGYYLGSVRNTKSQAQAAAKKYRAAGWNSRVVKIDDPLDQTQYAVYYGWKSGARVR